MGSCGYALCRQDLFKDVNGFLDGVRDRYNRSMATNAGIDGELERGALGLVQRSFLLWDQF